MEPLIKPLVKTRVAILISGRGSNMAALIEAAQTPDYPADIVLVLSNREDAQGLAFARSHGVQAVAIESRKFGRDREAHERAINTELTNAKVGIVCLAGYMRLLTPYLVGEWAGRMLNIHPSLLPKYPGLDTHQKVLEAGETVHGCSVHLVTAQMDGGPILAQARVPVLPNDTEATLAARVLVAEHRLYPETLAKFATQTGP